jgi:uncharacterized membrane protein
VTKGRAEAFSDGVIAILITIMVLELKVPHGADLAAVRPLMPEFLAYVLSFIYLGIYWNNHHHLFHAAPRINAKILWANLHLLFWLSLIPFATNWAGEHHDASLPTAVYGGVLLISGTSYLILQHAIVGVTGKDSKLAEQLRGDVKGPSSAVLYAAGMGLSFVRPWIAQLVYAGVAALWLIPDRRIERALHE